MVIDPTLVEKLDGELEADLEPRQGRLGKVRRYLDGDHDLPYQPKQAKAEYKALAQKSITNWTPLLPDTFGKGLFVDGYRPAKASDNSTAWDYWQANGLDARQSIAHRGALEYGTSYALVLPGSLGTKRVPYFRPLSPLRSAAWYQDEDDEYPELALRRKGRTIDGTQLVEIFDKTSVYTFAKPKDSSNWVLSKTEDHRLGVTPFVRFRNRLDGEARGIIRPIFTLQDRINEIEFSKLIAFQFAVFRQRWATGLAIPEDPDTGAPMEPFQAAIDRLWVAEDSEARFGDFSQTTTADHEAAYQSAVKTMAAIVQVSPNVLTGDLVNLSAEALAQMESSTQRKQAEYKTLFGESWESGFRLASLAAGNLAGFNDTSSQVRWRDTEPRSFSQTADALGKLAQMLEVPVEALWELIPNVTDQDIESWKALRAEAQTTDPLNALTAELSKQTAAQQLQFTPTAPVVTPPAPSNAPTPGA